MSLTREAFSAGTTFTFVAFSICLVSALSRSATNVKVVPVSPTRYARHIGACSTHQQPRNPPVAVVDYFPTQPMIEKLEADARLFCHVQHQGLGLRVLPVCVEEMPQGRRRIITGDRRNDRRFSHGLVKADSRTHPTSVSRRDARR